MDSQSPNNEHYLLSTEHSHSQRTVAKSFHMFEEGRHYRMMAIANHNHLEIYRNVGSSLVYSSSQHFMCNITVLLVVPIKGQNCDILFLADEEGRFMFWSPVRGAISASNRLFGEEAKLPFYQNDTPETKEPQFADIHYCFNSMTTEALLFFNVASSQVVVIRVEASGSSVNFMVPPSSFKIPYAEINFIGLLKGKNPSIGFVEQKEEKSILQIHSLSSDKFPLIFTLEKSNLSRFYCSPDSDELVTVCSTELSIISIKTSKTICNFQVNESGFVCGLDFDKYLYVGEVGSQMIAFGKKHFKNYGSILLENDRCVVVDSHGKLNDGAHLVSVIDQGFTVQILALYEDCWKQIKSISSVASIFSVQEMEPCAFRDPKQKQCLAVVRISDNIHQVGVISKKVPTKLEKQTPMAKPLLQALAFNNGQALILCSEEANTVMVYDKSSQNFELSFQLPPEHILLATDRHLVSLSKIYEIDLKRNRINEVYEQKDGMVAADSSGKFIGFQCSNFVYKFFNMQTGEIDWIRKNSHEDYIWRFHLSDTLLVGSMDSLSSLKVIPPFSPPKAPLDLRIEELVSDMRNIGDTDCLVVSFANSVINVYLVSNNQFLYTCATSTESMKFVKCLDGKGLLAYGVSSAYCLSLDNAEGILVKQVDFDGSKDIIDCIYLKELDKIFISHEDCVATYSLPTDKTIRQDHSSNFKILSVSISGGTEDSQPPSVATHDTSLYVANPYELLKRNLASSQLIKKQSHTLKEITCLENLQSGLLVCGVDDMEHAQLLLFDYSDLQILCSESLPKQVLSAVRKLEGDTFFVRVDQHVALYEYLPSIMGFKRKYSCKVDLYGYTLAIQPEAKLLILSDPLRYVAAYSYEDHRMTALSRYGNLNTINDIQFLNKSVVFGDTVGNLKFLEFNLGEDEVSRTRMTEVGSLRLGSEAMYIRKSKSDPKNSLLFCTLSGFVGRTTAIPHDKFIALKQAEKKALTMIQGQGKWFDYNGWRKRGNLEDKIIDEHLVEQLIRRSPEDALVKQLSKWWPLTVGPK